MGKLTMEEKWKVAHETVDLLNAIRKLEHLCGLRPLSEKEEDDRDAMMLHAALGKAEEEKG